MLTAVEHFMGRSDREQMSLLARESVETRTWGAINNQLINHYQSVIDARRIPAYPVGAVA